MRLIGMVAILAIGCGGKDEDTGTDAATDVTDADTDTQPDELCDIPQYDLASMTCAQLGSALENSVDAGNRCEVKEDCIVLRAQCEHWMETTCWHAVNKSCSGLAADGLIDIGAFNSAASSCGGTQVCSCGGTPDVDCLAGRCQAI